MKKNVGGLDKTARIAIGALLIAGGLAYGNLWGLLGAIPLITGIVGICPAYLPFGLSSAGSCGCGGGSCKDKNS